MSAHREPESESDDTIVVPMNDDTVVVVPTSDDDTIVVVADDNTVVAPVADATITVARPATVSPSQAFPKIGATENTSGKVRSGESGEPVIIAGNEVPPSLAKLLFKKPLDQKRRAPAAPFPLSQSSLPRGGVRSDIPVVYGTNSELGAGQPDGTDFARWLGPPPMGYELAAAERNVVVSVAKTNRAYRMVAVVGGACVVAVTAVGLWWVLTQLVQ